MLLSTFLPPNTVSGDHTKKFYFEKNVPMIKTQTTHLSTVWQLAQSVAAQTLIVFNPRRTHITSRLASNAALIKDKNRDAHTPPLLMMQVTPAPLLLLHFELCVRLPNTAACVWGKHKFCLLVQKLQQERESSRERARGGEREWIRNDNVRFFFRLQENGQKQNSFFTCFPRLWFSWRQGERGKVRAHRYGFKLWQRKRQRWFKLFTRRIAYSRPSLIWLREWCLLYTIVPTLREKKSLLMVALEKRQCNNIYLKKGYYHKVCNAF